MSIAENLTTIAENVPKVFAAGKKAEQRAFWEVFQKGGKRTTWQYAFAYADCWTDETYNPIYPITINSVNDNMYHQTQITNTKVPIIVDYTTLKWTFRLSAIETIPEITFSEKITSYQDVFLSASNLKNLNAKGTIAASFSISSCPLTVESLKSIISCLKDYSTKSPFAYTLTLKDSCKTKLESDTETAEFGGQSYTYFELITAKGWNLA